jgi:hypothetical protein
MKKTLLAMSLAIGLAAAMTPLTFAGQQSTSSTSNTPAKKSNKKVKKQKKSNTATKNSTAQK